MQKKDPTHVYPFFLLSGGNNNSIQQQEEPTVLSNSNQNITDTAIDDLFKSIHQPFNFDDMSIIEQQLKSLPDYSPNNNQQQQNMYIQKSNNSNNNNGSNQFQQLLNQQQNGQSLDIFDPSFLTDVDEQNFNHIMNSSNSHHQQHSNEQSILNPMPFTIPNTITHDVLSGYSLFQQPFVIQTDMNNATGLFQTTSSQPNLSHYSMSPNKQQQQHNTQQSNQAFNHYVIQKNNSNFVSNPQNDFAKTVGLIGTNPMSPLSSSTASPTNTILTSPSPNITPFNFQGIQVPDLIKLVEGFNKPVKEKQIGGRDNTRHALPRQVVELDVTKLPQNSNPAVISVRPVVMGVDKMTRKTNRLAVLGEKPFIRVSSQPVERWVVIFDDIVIQFASHNNGQKLSLKFELLDAEKQVVCSIDSYGFETITKRGIEKNKERRKAKDKRKRSSDTEDDDSVDEVTVEHVSPAFGFTSGGALVKVMGSGFVSTPLSKCVVRFGDKDAREVHTIKRNYIVCETPESDKAGLVDVSVLFGETLAQSDAKFQYIDPTNPMDLQIMIQHMIGNQNAMNNFNTDPSAFSNKCYEQSLFYSGKVSDECGFTVLHHASARGLFELSQYLVAQSVVNIDARDNYGRTALHWATFASSDLVCLYLLNNGANICATDEVGDNLLHIACRYSTAEHIQNVIGVLLKHDDKYRTNTNNIFELLTSKNNEGETPLDLARNMEMDDSIMNIITVLESVHQFCEASLSEYRIHELKDIILRSGEFNGKSITSIEGDNMSLTFDIQLKKDKLVLLINRDGNQIRTSIDYKQIAFLILCKPQLRAEITLNSKPLIELGDANGNWTTLNNHQYLSSCLSFYLEVANSPDLEKINKFICDNDLLYPFQSMCFCHRPTIAETNKVKSIPSPNTSTTNNVNKVTIMSQPINPLTQNQNQQTNIF